MSTARPVHMGASWRVAMRCVDRKFMLTPTPEVLNAFIFCLAVAADRYGIMVHAICVMSNHVHIDLTDPFLKVSEFRRDFKSLLARSLNCHYSRWEYFWAPDDGMQEVDTQEAAADGMVYTCTNPQAAGLVAKATAWPGLISTCADLGDTDDNCGAWKAHKPLFFFSHSEDSTLPDTAVLRLTPHPLAEDPKSFVEGIKKRIHAFEEKKRVERKKEGQEVLGAAAVLARRWYDTPNTCADRRRLNPRFAEPDTERRIQTLSCYKAFLKAYKKALQLWLATGRATFPAGTNKMRHYPGVTVLEAIP